MEIYFARRYSILCNDSTLESLKDFLNRNIHNYYKNYSIVAYMGDHKVYYGVLNSYLDVDTESSDEYCVPFTYIEKAKRLIKG